MTQPRRKVRLDEDDRKVLAFLAEDTSSDGYVDAVTLQRNTVWPIRPTVDSLRRRGLVSHNGDRELVYRLWKVTDAGREAIS